MTFSDYNKYPSINGIIYDDSYVTFKVIHVNLRSTGKNDLIKYDSQN